MTDIAIRVESYILSRVEGCILSRVEGCILSRVEGCILSRVEGLSKFYHIGHAQQRHDTLRDALVSTFKRSNVGTFRRVMGPARRLL